MRFSTDSAMTFARTATRCLALCAALLFSVPLLAGIGDSDLDGDVDAVDFAALESCLDGPVATSPGCELFDLSNNGTVDMRDFASFQQNFHGDGPIPGTLNVTWIHGSPSCSSDPNPPIQVHQYNDNTFILRQNKCLHYEAPFIYVLFGDEKVFIQDTGATSSSSAFPIQATIQDIIDTYEVDHGLAPLDVIVTHSHSHGDHVAGDGQFSGEPNTTVVGLSSFAVRNFFGFTSWPDEVVTYDLGGRVLDVMGIPGHQAASVAVYDRQTDILLTGDTLYPGRLYINDWDEYQDSTQRMVDFTIGLNIEHVLGTHIEMSSTPGDDYPIGTVYQPDEHVLQLGIEHLIELNDAVQAMGASPSFEVHDDFIIFRL